MSRGIEVLNRPSLMTLWLGATIGAVVLGFSLATSLSYQDGIYWSVAGLDIVLSFIFYPFGMLQFIFLNLIGQSASEGATQYFTPIKILGFVVALRRLADMMFRKRPLRVVRIRPVVWASLFVFSLGLSIFASRDIYTSVMAPERGAGLLTYVQLLIMFFLIIDFVGCEREIMWLLAVLVLGGVLNSGFAIYQFHWESLARVEGMIGNANEFGISQLALLCLIAPVLGSLAARWLLPAMLLALGPIAYSVLLSFSRGAFVAAVAVLLYGLLFLRLGRVRFKVALVAVIISGLVLAPEGFYDRIETIPAALSGTQLRGEGSIPTRLLYYGAGIQMGLDHPLTGVGLNQFNRHIATYSNLKTVKAGGAHNMYISVFAETGIFGLIAFLGFLFASFLAVRRRHRASSRERNFQMAFANGVELGNVVFLVGGLFGAFEYYKIFWIILALTVCVQQTSVSKKQSNDAI